HLYYKGLAANTPSFFNKLYFLLEAFRLKRYEKQLHHAQFIFALSSIEKTYFEERYGKEKTIYVPLFFQSNEKTTLSQTVKPFVLYHGDLSTSENVSAATFLIRQIASKDNHIPWIFAGKNPESSLLKCAKKYDNVSVLANLEEKELLQLIREAAVNILYTNQISGVKLKLLNALCNGRHCLANKEMLAGSGLEELCRIIPNNPPEILEIIKACLKEDFSESECIKREKQLNLIYNNTRNARKIMDYIS
ncbi:MAG: hypothetical protein LBH12_05905, partial [Dysgonamonadaceae bacterium]|nr:hypothetical protein [Dysgonamonadaceae bacterium]